MANAVPSSGSHQHHQHHKQSSNHTTIKDRDGAGHKQASKETDSDEGIDDHDVMNNNNQEAEEEGSSSSNPLLQWISDKMLPQVKSCGVYLAPSTIPGAGLGMFAGRHYNRNEIVTQGDIIIPLSEIDWHNGFQLDFFLWEEYTCTYIKGDLTNGRRLVTTNCSSFIPFSHPIRERCQFSTHDRREWISIWHAGVLSGYRSSHQL